MISKVVSNRGLPFTHAINPYRGCEFACRYCYARYAHEFLERTPEEFERKIYMKQNGAWLLAQELARLKPGTQIALGTATDPYQPIERRQKITRSLLEVFARTRGFRLGIVTKSTLIARDIDLLIEIARRHKLTIAHTVTTMNVKLARTLEPRAPRPDLRMRTLARMRESGLHAGVLCSPLMPGITDSRRSIDAVARAAKAADAKFFSAGPLFLKPCSLPTFFQFVAETLSRAATGLQTPLREAVPSSPPSTASASAIWFNPYAASISWVAATKSRAGKTRLGPRPSNRQSSSSRSPGCHSRETGAE